MTIKHYDFQSKTTIELVLERLNNSKFDFFLTGSRFFGWCKVTSDWDFFVVNSETIEQYLKNTDFKVEDTSMYTDTQTVKVFRHQFLPIHIQIVDNAILKADVQDVMKTILNQYPKMLSLLNSKSTRHDFWDFCFDFYSQTRKSISTNLRIYPS